jgi:putative oxygen-independent coproporphyrinogen III oxidase
MFLARAVKLDCFYSMNPTAAYLHIPFCRRRCFYCDFPITVVGDRPPLSRSQLGPQDAYNEYGTIRRYLEVLKAEITLTASQGQGSRPLQTIFFGGGTPSLLTPAQITDLLQHLRQHFGVPPGAEISMEIDPGTFDLPKLTGFQTAGVNRFSLGAQAFQPHLLKACGRSHQVDDIHQAVGMLSQLDITNYSLDLISGLPHQSLADWSESLDAAIALQPAHISCYDLIIEPQTPFAKQYQPGDRPLPDDDTTAEMYRLAHHRLEAAGYEHYEISNYAKPGWQCRHNRVYWQHQNFYGFGLGATSDVAQPTEVQYLQAQRSGAQHSPDTATQHHRQARPRQTQAYFDWVAAGACISEIEPASPADELLEKLMLGLRLAEGVEIAPLVQQFGPDLITQVQQGLVRYIQPGWVNITPTHLRLTRPEGFLFSNGVLAKLFELLEPEAPTP